MTENSASMTLMSVEVRTKKEFSFSWQIAKMSVTKHHTGCTGVKYRSFLYTKR